MGKGEEKYKIVLSIFVLLWFKGNVQAELRNGSRSFVELLMQKETTMQVYDVFCSVLVSTTGKHIIITI